MGIQGLLQALKPIHVKKHLQEYSGKTIAVDSYVWLHKGLYSCATELATGKKTHKYVDYAMHRVRLLRHYNIQPYIVFDGGPLPAKRGTEQQRKQKREEYLSKGNGLAAQGKHSQARECYVKCVDVTPQMAFQFIKALRAERVPYVVAPYEADAQLAYLEKIGLVDAILTEDSDLLVFGCKNVLYKLDIVDNSVTSICRDQFGSVTSSSDPNSISLYGWSDTQFRAMAILSGCDYLLSIPGVGLKTANSLLRKWKTAEQVIRAIAMEGKKSVPINYWKEFQLAEMCFLYQRVYCPLSKKLVHLKDPEAGLNDETNAYVGSNLESKLAEEIAVGDVCPISQLPMVDINPSFVPHTNNKPLPRVLLSPSKPRTTKGKMRESLPSGGILDFFGPSPIIPRPKASKPISIEKPNLTGKASGKRTLADVLDKNLERKKRRRKSPSPMQLRQSRFFAPSESRSCSMRRRHSEGELQFAGLARHQGEENKENEYIMVVDEDDEVDASCSDLEGSDLSIKAQFDASDVFSSMKFDATDFLDLVEQEDGYISPKDAQDLSSPIRPRDRQKNFTGEGSSPSVNHFSEKGDADFAAQILSSPTSARRPKPSLRPLDDYQTPVKWTQHISNETILAGPTPSPTKQPHRDSEDVPSPTLYRGPDLRSMLGANCTSELDMPCEAVSGPSSTASPPSPSPDTPREGGPNDSRMIDVDEFDLEEEEEGSGQTALRNKAVMDGWRRKWSLQSLQVQADKSSSSLSAINGPKVFALGSGALRAANLRRSDTAAIMPGPRGGGSFYKPPKSAPSKIGALNVPKPKKGRLVFESTKVTSSAMRSSKTVANIVLCAEDTGSSATGPVEPEMSHRLREKLSQYRCS